MLTSLDPKRGDTVLHIGCGTGYYSAILALLVGPSGKVIAYEIEPDLASLAREYLRPWRNVEVRARSGTDGELPRCQAIYVNAGATRVLGSWLDALDEGGRRLFPLTSSGQKRLNAAKPDMHVGTPYICIGSGQYGSGIGVTLLVTRHNGSFSAKVIGQCGFIDCAGGTDADEGFRVTEALKSGDLWRARSLVRHVAPDGSAVLIGQDWWLSSASVV
jgi:protein-L-isoaspartate(D-aspartate) O-methyltransferase